MILQEDLNRDTVTIARFSYVNMIDRLDLRDKLLRDCREKLRVQRNRCGTLQILLVAAVLVALVGWLK